MAYTFNLTYNSRGASHTEYKVTTETGPKNIPAIDFLQFQLSDLFVILSMK